MSQHQPPSPEKIFQNSMMALVNSTILATACEYSLFTHIEQGTATADALANRAGIT